MKRTIKIALVVLVFAAIAVEAKLPKCSSVKCRDLGCPADVLCVSGSKVQTCADACNGH